MSNFLSIATVTATLRQMLQAGIQADVTDASITVSTSRPETSTTDTVPTGVNLFLYQITANAALRNADLPGRSPGGQVVRRPRAALDLHYLMSFHGDEKRLEPQRMLGSTVRILNGQPQLTRDQITAAIGDPSLPFLAASDLADEIEMVHLTPAALTLDELSKLWSIFYQMPYALSLAYVASVVFIEGGESARAAPPVQRYNTYTLPSLGPHITRLLSQSAPGQPAVAEQFVLPGYQLVVQGERLRGEITRVSVGGVVVTPAPDAVRGEWVSLPLPAGLRPGLQAVQVLHPLELGTPPAEHRGLESNVAPFILHPLITATATVAQSRTVDGVTLRDGTVQVGYTPRIGLRQRVVLALNELTAAGATSARAYSFTPRLPHPPSPAGAADTDSTAIAFTNVAAGTYLVRVQVDGAESPLSRDAGGRYSGPVVTI